MEIIKNFGLDPFLILAQVINFLIILYVLKRFLYPPIFKLWQQRKDLAKVAIENAEESKRALDSAKEKEKEILKDARAGADKILQDAKDQATVILLHAEERAKIQSERTLEEARAQIIRETETAEKSLAQHIGTLSINLLKKSLPTVLTTKDQQELVDKAIKELKV